MEIKKMRYSYEDNNETDYVCMDEMPQDNNETDDVCMDEMPQNFSMLPDEIVIIIFSFLKRKELLLNAALVCSRWRRLTDDCSLWRSLDLHSNKGTTASLSRIFKKYNRVVELYLDGCPAIKDSLAADIPWSRLQSLSLARCKQLSPESFMSIAYCSSLEILNVSRCHVNNETLIAIAQACCHLKSLDLSFCDEFNSVGLLEILNKCTRLKKLYLRGCYEIGDDILPALPQTIEHLDISKCCFNKKRSLKHLHNLHHLTFLDVSHVNKIDDEILAGFSNLTYLAANRCRRITNVGISLILARNPKLECLHIVGCIYITDEAFEMIPRSSCRLTLESLFVQGCFVGVIGIEAILLNCPKMTRIIFNDIPDPIRARWAELYPRVDIDPE